MRSSLLTFARPRLPAPLLVLGMSLAVGGVAAQTANSADAVPDPERVPVVLVPGWGDEATGIAPLRDRLVDAGWENDQVFALTFADPWGSNEEHAREVEGAVRTLLRDTGSSQVDVVAHSMGGLALREFLAVENRAPLVRRAVFLGTPHRGTVAAILAWGDGGREMAPGSDFLARLNAQDAPEDVQMLAVRSVVDLRIIPGSSAMLPGAYNVEVCCPSHVGMVNDDRTFEEVLGFLSHGPHELSSPDGTIPLRTDPGWWREAPWNR